MGVANPNPVHPGEVLEEIYLKDRGWSQSKLAEEIGCAPRKVNEIVRGKRSITADFAVDLERVLGTTADMWVSMQGSWELAQARKRKAG